MLICHYDILKLFEKLLGLSFSVIETWQQKKEIRVKITADFLMPIIMSRQGVLIGEVSWTLCSYNGLLFV